jgi:tripartite-type tricarboxylate transporter receptor subunit TctC
MSINPLTMRNLSYVPERDLVPLSMLTDIPMVVLVNSSVPAKTFEELIGIARSRPGSLNHASGGLGSMLPSELLKSLAKIDYVEIPYPGAAPAATAVMSGSAELMITDVASARTAIDSGRVRPLAVTSKTRSKFYPHLPTVAESGLPDYQTSVWIGLFAPAGTPENIIEKIRADVQKVLKMPDVRSRFESLGMEPGSGTGDDLIDAMARETDKWRKLVKERNLKFN